MSDLAGEMGACSSVPVLIEVAFTNSSGAGAGGMEVTDKLEGTGSTTRWSRRRAVFHSLMVHKGVANRSNRLRLSMDARFQRVDQPIAPGSLEPHGREVRNWEQVYADWPPEAG